MAQAIPAGFRDLLEKKALAHLATLMPDGSPQSTPVWVDLHDGLVRPADVLRALKVPTLWLTGDEDIVYPPFLSDILAKVMPNARVAQVRQAGHSVYFERPAEFNRIVDEFLGANR